MFNIINMLPIQLKHNHETHGLDHKIGLDYLKDISINENEFILLVEEFSFRISLGKCN